MDDIQVVKIIIIMMLKTAITNEVDTTIVDIIIITRERDNKIICNEENLLQNAVKTHFLSLTGDIWIT